MKKPENKLTKKPFELITNPGHPVLWGDNMHVLIREDNVALIRVYATLPEGHVEQTKFAITLDRLKSIIDLTCEHLDYFPQKKGEGKVEKVKNKK